MSIGAEFDLGMSAERKFGSIGAIIELGVRLLSSYSQVGGIFALIRIAIMFIRIYE